LLRWLAVANGTRIEVGRGLHAAALALLFLRAKIRFLGANIL
jgi:hypothetical protein